MVAMTELENRLMYYNNLALDCKFAA